MEKRNWLWKRKSSEKSSVETESSGSISSHSEKNCEDQEASKASPSHDSQSPEVTSKAAVSSEEVNDSVKNLTLKLSAALLNVSAKENLVKQHAKVAEEAVAGWENAENEVAILRQQLEAAVKKNLALEDRVSHFDGALKECVRQLRQAREEQEKKINEAVVKKTQDLESTKSELQSQLLELQTQVAASKAESSAIADPDKCHELDLLERENSALKLQLLAQSEELEIRTIERDLSTQAAETASKQHLESIKKVAKLEGECRRLKAAARKSSSVNDQKSVAASSFYVDSLTDSQSDSGERLNAVEIDTRKMSNVEVNDCEPSCSDSWASALIAELDQFKNEKAVRNLTASPVEIDLMDDFLEMERLASLPPTQSGSQCLESQAVANQSVNEENPLRLELDGMQNRTSELEGKLEKKEAEKAELGEKLGNIEEEKAKLEEKLDKIEAERTELKEKLDKMEADRAELEMALTESQEHTEASQIQLREAQMKLGEMQRELALANEEKKLIESQLIGIEVDVRTMSAKIESLVGEVERERALSAEIAVKCRELEDELSRKKQEAELLQTANSNGDMKIKQEDLAVAAGKLAECQKTIASLGKQLKSLATLEDFLIDTTNLPEFSEGGSQMGRAGGELWRLHSNDTFLPKRDSDSLNKASENSGASVHSIDGNSPVSSSSSTSSLNHVSSEKSRNGFVKLFSRSKGGIQPENQLG